MRLMEFLVGAKLRDKRRDAWLASLTPRLYPGEQLLLLATNNLLRPLCDGLAITNARIVAFQGAELGQKGFKLEAFASDIAGIEISERRGNSYLVLQRRSTEDLVVGSVHKSDVAPVLRTAQEVATSGTPAEVQAAVAAHGAQAAAQRDLWRQVEVIGSAPNEKAWRTLRDHALPGEAPWFVIGVGAGGVFAAFADRCMIVKVGALTSMMTGSLGGGRITAFPLAEITGVEYNGGLVNGVLEILTPSYQGSANKDFWRGTTSSRNADSNDPWTLSNTLPMAKQVYQQALPRLNEMRARITEAKRPTVTIASSSLPSPHGTQDTLTEELTKLTALYQQGALTEAEFVTAKQAALQRYGA